MQATTQRSHRAIELAGTCERKASQNRGISSGGQLLRIATPRKASSGKRRDLYTYLRKIEQATKEAPHSLEDCFSLRFFPFVDAFAITSNRISSDKETSNELRVKSLTVFVLVSVLRNQCRCTYFEPSPRSPLGRDRLQHQASGEGLRADHEVCRLEVEVLVVESPDLI